MDALCVKYNNKKLMIGKRDDGNYIVEFRRLIKDKDDLKPPFVHYVKKDKIKVSGLLLSPDSLEALHYLITKILTKK